MRRPLTSRLAAAALAAAASALSAGALAAQGAPSGRSVDVSGIIFGNFQYHAESGHDEAADEQVRAGLERNQFVLERLYLTVRSTLSPRTSVRATAEVYNGSAGYQLRAKYAYLDHKFPVGKSASAFVRAGVLQNIVVDHEESYWPRFVATSPLVRAGYFSAADLGVAVGGTFPRNMGEVYAEVVDGRGSAGLGSADDRFKDFGARVTLTPFAGAGADASAAGAVRALRGLVISPWYYRGDTASVFGPNSARSGVAGYLGPVDTGRQRDRYGLFAALDDPRVVLGVSLARRRSELESGDNTQASPITTSIRTANLVGTFAVVRPFAFADSAGRSPFALLLRYDREDANTGAPGHTRYVVAGMTYDLSPYVSVGLDYQETMPQGGQAATRSTLRQIYFARLQARF